MINAQRYGFSDWQAGFVSDVGPGFVEGPELPWESPAPARASSQTRTHAPMRTYTIRFRVPLDAPVHGARLRAIIDGIPHRISMTRPPARELPETLDCETWAWWEATVVWEQPGALRWQFVLVADDGPWFATRAGLSRIQPTEDHDWVLLPRAEIPGWTRGTVFYQIYPDRFARAGAHRHRESGEYTFDGGQPVAMAWDAEPLEWEEGRCLDFFNGDLDGIRERIPYLTDLGVTAVYVNPIFAARTTHRYDCIDYLRVDDALGGNEALARLTDALHGAGIRLVVDISINHTGSEHHWIRRAIDDPDGEEAGRYYRESGDGDGLGSAAASTDAPARFATWMGVPTLPQLNYASRGLRADVWEGEHALLRHWLRPPYAIDGWRFDVANQTGRRGADQYGELIWRGVRRAVKETNPDAWIVAEHWEDNISYLQGDMWDGAMNYFGCGHPLRRWAGEYTRYDEAGPEYPPTAVAPTGRRYSGIELAQMLCQHLTRLPNEIVHAQLNVLDTHDIHRLHHAEGIFDWELYRGVVMMQFLLPGSPNIWYGDEVGLAGHARSVEGCRYPMQWDEARWDERFRALYRTLARLKRDESLLHDGAFIVPYADETTVVLARVSATATACLLVVASNAENATTVRIPTVALGPVVEVSEIAVGDAHDRSRAGASRDASATATANAGAGATSETGASRAGAPWPPASRVGVEGGVIAVDLAAREARMLRLVSRRGAE